MHVISLKCLYIDILVILVQDGLFFHSKWMALPNNEIVILREEQ